MRLGLEVVNYYFRLTKRVDHLIMLCEYPLSIDSVTCRNGLQTSRVDREPLEMFRSADQHITQNTKFRIERKSCHLILFLGRQ